MRERSLLPLGLLVLLSASSMGFGLTPRQASAAPQAAANRTVDLKVENVDVREALRTVFKAFKSQPHTISPEVRGAVRADFRGLVLDDALSVLLRQVNAMVRGEGGVYQIVSRAEPSPIVVLDGWGSDARDDENTRSYGIKANQAPPAEPPVVASDAAFLYVVRGGVAHKIEKATMKVVGKADLNECRIRVTC